MVGLLQPLERGVLGVPVFSSQRIYGWIELIDKLGVDEFSEADEVLAVTLATEVALAYENAILNEALQRYTKELEQEVSERKWVEAALQESAECLSGLSRRLLEVQEDERRHIARELHDEVGQLLTGLKLSLETCRRLPADVIRLHLDQAQTVVSELIARVRDISLHLRPAMLDDFGLLPALLWHIERYTLQTHVRIRLERRGLEKRLAPQLETAAYRIVQEALTNIARYARVQEASVRLWVQAETLVVEIEDQGLGFHPEAALAERHTSGLAGMRERARLVGGRFVVDPAPEAGTKVRAELPLDSSSDRPRAITTEDHHPPTECRI